jgi:surfactin synthase thioesterase subunit
MGLSYGGIIAFELLRQALNRIKKIPIKHNSKKTSEQTKINQQLDLWEWLIWENLKRLLLLF